MYWAHLFKLWSYTVLLKVQIYKKLEIRTRGMESRVPNTSLHVVFLDFDNVVGKYSEDPEQRLKEELQFLQNDFEVGDFLVFGTRENGRHAVCVDALTFRDVKDIVDFSSCDLKFKKAPSINEYRCWVLRIGKKGKRPPPKYLYTVESPFEGQNPQSLAHANYLFDNYGVKIDLKNPVGDSALLVQDYNTTEKHGLCCIACEKALKKDFQFCPYCGAKQEGV